MLREKFPEASDKDFEDQRDTSGYARAGAGCRPIKRILVALDALQRADLVLATATSLARSMGAMIRLFRAVPMQPEIPWDLIRVFPPGGLEELLSEQAKADLEARMREVPSELLDGVATAVGTAWSVKHVEAAIPVGLLLLNAGVSFSHERRAQGALELLRTKLRVLGGVNRRAPLSHR